MTTPLYVQETEIIKLLASFKGFTYGFASKGQAPRYPFDLPGIGVQLAPPKQNDCSTFVEALLVKAWANVHGRAFVWNMDRHEKMMIQDPDHVYSPVTAVIEASMAKAVSSTTRPPPPWSLVQGWTTLKPLSGHTFLVVAVDPVTSRVLTLESNFTYGMSGPGCRELGDLDSFTNLHPGKDWPKDPSLWTWLKFVSTYPYMQLAQLNVLNPTWAGSGGASTGTLPGYGPGRPVDKSEADPTTLPVLQKGDRGEHVELLQRELAKRNFASTPADGVFGSNTDAAVRAFQSSRRLTADGIVGEKTWTALLG
ncbi:peptidoglycan-binding protein [Variovorax sp. J22R115]|uniref:peptidoglycan-binding domain-containing protein n=1 Tax=Variovorax sp. J22R115 TaxID=3053509 RepID=UPI002575AFE1|nr:peptidoglycan-binding domain-containing protein [Variovorax sp. J22R115]MDM0053034.1 peptidoglycan-binding domain-containing protein [Variovorax sp. J22R115]